MAGPGNQPAIGADYLAMDCRQYREALSARIDGEDTGLEAAAVDAHLTACPGCQAWADQAVAVTRRARLAQAEQVPDLTAPIMAALSGAGGRAAAGRNRRVAAGRSQRVAGSPVGVAGRSRRVAAGRSRHDVGASPAGVAGVARLGLLLVAGAQLCLAVPALLGKDAGASIHIAHEQGSWALAFAVGLLVVAARPARAAGILPLVGALAAGLAFTMALDIWAGRAQAASEAPHGLAFLGLGLLWLLARDAGPHFRGPAARPA